MINKALRQRLVLLSIFIGWVGVTITPLLDSVTVTSEYDLTRHRLGLPLPIIEQHTSLTPMEDAYPFELGFVSPQEHTTTLLTGNYLFLLVTAVFVVYMSLLSIKYIIKRIR
jgi:hypothetical protein